MRVEGFWKISATLRPARESDSGARLQLQGAIENRRELVAVQLGSGEKVTRHRPASLG